MLVPKEKASTIKIPDPSLLISSSSKDLQNFLWNIELYFRVVFDCGVKRVVGGNLRAQSPLLRASMNGYGPLSPSELNQ